VNSYNCASEASALQVPASPPYCIDVGAWSRLYALTSAQVPFRDALTEEVTRVHARGQRVVISNVPAELEDIVAALTQE
jgi:hypothetical protein